MAVDKKLRKLYFNRCKPDEPLLPGDDRNVDVDTLIAEARGRNWVDALANRIELSDEPLCELFTGLPGSGKSTELRRLAARLEREDGAHLLPIVIDAEDVIDLWTTVDIPDLLIAILVKTEEGVLVCERKDPKTALQVGALKRFWNWLTNTEVELKTVEAQVGAKASIPEVGEISIGPKVVADLKTRPLLRQRVRSTLANHVTAFLKQLRDAIGELDERAKGLGYEGIVVIFDSLEKLRGTTTSWRDVLASAERVFSNGAAALQLPVHVVYTLPTALTMRLNTPVTFLPMFKLYERSGGRCAAGFEAARAIVRSRVPEHHLKELLGPTSAEDRVKRLIAWSGGYPREIVRLLQNCIAEPNLDEALFVKLLSLAADEYKRTVPESVYAWLARVHLDRSLILPEDAQREMADLMLQNNIVLCYQNNDPWFDLHPAVITIPGIAGEVEKLRKERGQVA